jgi:hypothetical protein
MVQDFPQVAAIFRNPTAMQWLDAISESNSILSAILAVIHPQLYHAGQETFDKMRKNPGIEHQDVLHWWTSAFSGVSVIYNCIMPPHQDG